MPTKPTHPTDDIRSFQMPSGFWIQRAGQSVRQGNLPRAGALLRHALGQEENPQTGLEYAWLLRRVGCTEGSCRECLWQLARWPGLFGAYGLLALNLLDMGRKREAVDAYMIYSQYMQMFPGANFPWDDEVYDIEEDLLLIPGEERRYARSETLLKRAWAALDQGDRDMAQQLHDRLCRMQGHPTETLCLGASLSQDEEFCLLAARNGAALCHGNVRLLLRCAEAAGRFSRREAGRLLLRAACLVRNPDDLAKLCSLCRRFGMEWIAQGELQAALHESPARLDVLFQLCVFALARGDGDEVARLSRRLETLDPEDPAVEKLLRLARRMDQATPEERLSQPFYYEPDPALTEDCLKLVREKLGQPSPIMERADRMAWQYLLSGALEPAKGVELLYRLMPRPGLLTAPLMNLFLLGQPGNYGVRRVGRMLCRFRKPPYMAHHQKRLQLVNPAGQIRPAGFFLRKRQEMLLKVKRRFGPEALPVFLKTLDRLPRRQQVRFVVNREGAWLPAFAAELARQNRQPLPVMHAYMLWPPRYREWRTARRYIRRAMEQLNTLPHMKGEPT